MLLFSPVETAKNNASNDLEIGFHKLMCGVVSRLNVLCS